MVVERATDGAEFLVQVDGGPLCGVVLLEVHIAGQGEHVHHHFEELDGLWVGEVVDVDEPLYRQSFSNTMTNFG